VHAKPLDVGDKIPGRVVLEARMGAAAAAAALVKEEDAVARGIEEPPRPGIAARARAAVQENDRLALRVAAFLPVNLVAVADGEMPLVDAARSAGSVRDAGSRPHILAILASEGDSL
jgi:hypothetical protein